MVKRFENRLDNITYYVCCSFNNGINLLFVLNTTSGALSGYILQKGCMRFRRKFGISCKCFKADPSKTQGQCLISYWLV